MTNEETSIAIQKGNAGLLAPLWEQNKALCCKLARRYVEAARLAGLEWEDLEQCAFLALHRAAMAFDPDKGYKLTAYIKRALLGVLRGYLNGEPVPASLDDDLTGDGFELRDTVPDPAAELALEDTEERIWREQLREDLEICLGQIEPEAAEALRGKYFHGEKPPAKLAAAGMRQIRAPKVSGRLRGYYEDIQSFHVFHGGYGAFLSAQASSVEIAVERVTKP